MKNPMLQSTSQSRIEIHRFCASDGEFLSSAMEELMQYLVPLDPDDLLICPSGYGQIYAKNLIDRVTDGNGQILVAAVDGMPAGIVAGIIKSLEPHDAMGSRMKQIGEVLELIVMPTMRYKGIGRSLMNAMEYFLENNCDSMGVGVFAPNQLARRFYEQLGFRDRVIWCHKKLK
jgi:ribosomal protein S18 acetylase RimI-like enzyme